VEQPNPRRYLWYAVGVLAAAGLVAALAWLTVRRTKEPGLVARAPGPESVIAEVRNGTTQPGLARQVTRFLREQGVDVVYFGTADTPLDSTRILVRRGPLARGREVALVLSIGLVTSKPDSTLRVDVTVLIGKDFRFPKNYRGF
jgi:LytR cell envelope-related transcriptional attenuator